MKDHEAIDILKKSIGFNDNDIDRLEIFRKSLLNFNSNYNLISRNTIDSVWTRHILDSAQILKHFSTKEKAIMADFGTGAGFPGLVIALYNKNPEFHVKLYEKSPVKREFLNKISDKLNLKVEINEYINEKKINADIVVCRAFKKLQEIMRISREIVKKPHKLIILKGKNAQEEINNVSLGKNYRYNLVNSITNADSKIIIVDAV
jgi:16S rRNA (guanine527-N7)-methyltransferase